MNKPFNIALLLFALLPLDAMAWLGDHEEKQKWAETNVAKIVEEQYPGSVLLKGLSVLKDNALYSAVTFFDNLLRPGDEDNQRLSFLVADENGVIRRGWVNVHSCTSSLSIMCSDDIVFARSLSGEKKSKNAPAVFTLMNDAGVGGHGEFLLFLSNNVRSDWPLIRLRAASSRYLDLHLSDRVDFDPNQLFHVNRETRQAVSERLGVETRKDGRLITPAVKGYSRSAFETP